MDRHLKLFAKVRKKRILGQKKSANRHYFSANRLDTRGMDEGYIVTFDFSKTAAARRKHLASMNPSPLDQPLTSAQDRQDDLPQGEGMERQAYYRGDCIGSSLEYSLIYLDVFAAPAVEEYRPPVMAIDGMRMGVLTKPVAAVLAQRPPLQASLFPVRDNP